MTISVANRNLILWNGMEHLLLKIKHPQLSSFCHLPRIIMTTATPPTFFNSQFLHTHTRNNNNNICTLTTKISYVKFHRSEFFPPLSATLNGPKGFGPSPKKKKKTKKLRIDNDEEENEDEEEEEGIIPEIVTNRMISRMGFSVGIPLGIGLMFFPFFYYLKVGLKIDVPTWVPFIVSFFFFGSALLGVSYGIVSSSWDPLREGSLLGWTEAQKNWPVFWQSLRGGSSRKS